MSIVGLDLSLTATGLATTFAGQHSALSLKPRAGLLDLDRIEWIVGQLGHWCPPARLVCMEGPSYGSGAGQKGHHERAGLWWMVRRQLRIWDVDVAIVPPSNLKKFACGKGNASKDEVLLATGRRFPDFSGDNNAADALWLAAMGADHLGVPLVAMPAVNRAALDGVRWPITSEESSVSFLPALLHRPGDPQPPPVPRPPFTGSAA